MAGKKGRSGRPAFKPTDDERKMVSQMVAVGIPIQQVAQVVRDGIAEDTLRKHFEAEIRESKIKANAKIGGSLYNRAINGDTAAAIFWAKTQMGWRETQNVSMVDGDGNALPVQRIEIVAPSSDREG